MSAGTGASSSPSPPSAAVPVLRRRSTIRSASVRVPPGADVMNAASARSSSSATSCKGRKSVSVAVQRLRGAASACHAPLRGRRRPRRPTRAHPARAAGGQHVGGVSAVCCALAAAAAAARRASSLSSAACTAASTRRPSCGRAWGRSLRRGGRSVSAARRSRGGGFALQPCAPALPLLLVNLVALLARLQQNLVAQPAGQQLHARKALSRGPQAAHAAARACKRTSSSSIWRDRLRAARLLLVARLTASISSPRPAAWCSGCRSRASLRRRTAFLLSGFTPPFMLPQLRRSTPSYRNRRGRARSCGVPAGKSCRLGSLRHLARPSGLYPEPAERVCRAAPRAATPRASPPVDMGKAAKKVAEKAAPAPEPAAVRPPARCDRAWSAFLAAHRAQMAPLMVSHSSARLKPYRGSAGCGL
jgi:hypothetical protein